MTRKDSDLKLCAGIALLGIFLTCYLWTFENGGNHWELFGTPTERFLMGYSTVLTLVFSGCLLVPLLFKRDQKRWLIGILAIPVYFFLWYSLRVFLD